jgi:hypothetical protein
MARTITRVGEEMHSFGDQKAVHVDMNITSYATGGEALAPGDFGLERLDNVIVTSQAGGYMFVWLPTTRFLKAMTAAATEAAATTAIGLIRITGIGK